MLKLFENRFINTTNKLAVSIEDIKHGRFGGEDKGRDGVGGGGVGGAGITHDVMSVLEEQHNSLLLVLAAQTQKLDNLEQVCLHRTRSDEQGQCSGGGEPPSRPEFAPKIEEIHQLVGNLKERLADADAVKERLAIAEAECLDLQDNLEKEKIRVEELQGKLRSAQQALDEGARERRHSSSNGRPIGSQSKIERFQAVLQQRLHRSAPAGGDALPRRPPLTAASTDGMREGTPSVLHMQAELVHKSNHTVERGRGRSTERQRVSSSRARASNSLSLEGLQGKLRSAQQATDEGARERPHSSYKGRFSSGSLGNDLETIGDRFQAQVDTMYQQPFSAALTGGMHEGTSTVMHMQAELAELAQTSNHIGERGQLGRGSDTERRARAWFRQGMSLVPRTRRGPA
jgi:hypothetical protein